MEKNPTNVQQTEQTSKNTTKQRAGAFNETKQGDEKSTINTEQETELEKERKEATSKKEM